MKSQVLRIALLAAPLILQIGIARGDMYAIPTDFRVTCLDLESGRVVWQTRTGKLGPPSIKASDRAVIAQSSIRGHDEAIPALRYGLDAATGELLASAILPEKEGVSEPLQPLPQNLKCSDGGVLEFDPGATRDLVAVYAGERRIVKRSNRFTYQLHVAGDLAIHTHSAEGGNISEAGNVFAFAVNDKAPRWSFTPYHLFPPNGKPRYAWTGIAVDSDRVLVTADQTIFALGVEDGKFLWQLRLPRQEIRRYDSPWTQIGRLDDRLFIRCYEDLFVVRRTDGKLLWSLDCGELADPWPTVRGERVYVGTR
jgi:outer membrane protein assembly factor BamB